MNSRDIDMKKILLLCAALLTSLQAEMLLLERTASGVSAIQFESIFLDHQKK
jgi:hypothetical protein